MQSREVKTLLYCADIPFDKLTKKSIMWAPAGSPCSIYLTPAFSVPNWTPITYVCCPKYLIVESLDVPMT